MNTVRILLLINTAGKNYAAQFFLFCLYGFNEGTKNQDISWNLGEVLFSCDADMRKKKQISFSKIHRTANVLCQLSWLLKGRFAWQRSQILVRFCLYLSTCLGHGNPAFKSLRKRCIEVNELMNVSRVSQSN